MGVFYLLKDPLTITKHKSILWSCVEFTIHSFSFRNFGFWWLLVLGRGQSTEKSRLQSANKLKQTASNCFCFKALSPSQYSHLSFPFILSKPQCRGFLTAEFNADFCLGKTLKICQGIEGWAKNTAVISECILHTMKKHLLNQERLFYNSFLYIFVQLLFFIHHFCTTLISH